MSPNSTLPKREPLLDLLRWSAALLVAFSHWILEVPHLFNSGLPNLLSPIAREGGVGVPIFFIVSGYVISLTAARKASGPRFAYARFVRLFPGLLISMLVVLVVGNRFITPYSQPLESFLSSVSLTYTFVDIQPLTSVLWTLIVEIKFYFAITLILLIKRDIFQKPIWIISLLFLLLILEETNLLGIFSYFNNQLSGCIKLFLLGISLHFFTRLIKTRIVMAVGFGALSLIYVWEILGSDKFGIGDRMISLAIVLIVCSSFVQFPNRLATLANLLGLASYPIYLVHTHLGTVLINISNARIDNATFVFLGVGVILLTLLCVMINLFTEQPLQKALMQINRLD